MIAGTAPRWRVRIGCTMPRKNSSSKIGAPTHASSPVMMIVVALGLEPVRRRVALLVLSSGNSARNAMPMRAATKSPASPTAIPVRSSLPVGTNNPRSVNEPPARRCVTMNAVIVKPLHSPNCPATKTGSERSAYPIARAARAKTSATASEPKNPRIAVHPPRMSARA